MLTSAPHVMETSYTRSPIPSTGWLDLCAGGLSKWMLPSCHPCLAMMSCQPMSLPPYQGWGLCAVNAVTIVHLTWPALHSLTADPADATWHADAGPWAVCWPAQQPCTAATEGPDHHQVMRCTQPRRRTHDRVTLRW